MDAVRQNVFIFITVYSILSESEAITVRPFLCPTTKISPRPRQPHASSFPQEDGTVPDSWKVRNPRTIDLIYDLLGPSRPQRQVDQLSGLHEQPQEHDRGDCGDRLGFGKKDLSFVTKNGTAKKSDREDRKYTEYNQPPYSPGANIIEPLPPSQRPLKPGLKVDNPRPVWEYILEPPPPKFQPDLIGGPLAFIIGVSSRRPPIIDPPTEGPLTEEPLKEEQPPKESSAPIRFPENNFNDAKKTRQGKSTSIITSLIADLLMNSY